MDFKPFPKIPRFSRDIIITEKIDGSNGLVFIYSPKDKLRFPFCDERDIPSQEFIDKYCLSSKDELYIFSGSKNRWLNTSKNGDNHNFAKWVQLHAEELLQLGEGKHYGEFYGSGIQRGYGLTEKRWALFNVSKWANKNEPLKEGQSYCPDCCEVVPILYEGMFDTQKINEVLEQLKTHGSYAVPYMNPEGIIIFHAASGHLYKKTIIGDEQPKGQINP